MMVSNCSKWKVKKDERKSVLIDRQRKDSDNVDKMYEASFETEQAVVKILTFSRAQRASGL